jgi:hypothetical protein
MSPADLTADDALRTDFSVQTVIEVEELLDDKNESSKELLLIKTICFVLRTSDKRKAAKAASAGRYGSRKLKYTSQIT